MRNAIATTSERGAVGNAVRLAHALTGALAGGVALPFLILMLWGRDVVRIGAGQMPEGGFSLFGLMFWSRRICAPEARPIFLGGLVVGALSGAVWGATRQTRNLSRRGEIVGMMGASGASIGFMLAGFLFDHMGYWPGVPMTGMASGLVSGIILGRLLSGGRIRLWEMMVAVALIALVFRVIVVWL